MAGCAVIANIRTLFKVPCGRRLTLSIGCEPMPLDVPDPELGYPTQLYKFSAVAYESLMVGLFAIFKGPPNEIAAQKGIPKTIDLTVGFSRPFSAPPLEPFW